MIYVLYGEEKFLISEEINDILKKESIEALNVVRYDLEVDSMKSVIDDACTLSLFESKKMVIADNLDLYLKNEKNTILLENYIDNINSDVVLVFTSCNRLDDRKKVVKKLKEKAKVLEFNKLKNVSNIVKKMFDDYKIDYSCIDLIINLVGSDLSLLKSEVCKLKTYKDNKEITKEDILDLCVNNNNDDIFDLIGYIVNKDKEKAFILYDDLIKKNEEPIKIIITLANQFRLIYQVKKLYNEGNSKDSIADILKVHPYRVKLALEKSNSYSSKMLLKYLSMLADIDYNIKNGLIDKNLALELFILNT